MSDIPPKHVPVSSSYETSKTDSGLVAIYQATSHANAESFPVLKAFQDYIEAERAQARKRVIQLSIFFAILMSVVVTGFLTAGIFMLNNMTAVQNKLLDVALANTTRQSPPVQPPVTVSAAPIEDSLRNISRVTSDLKTSIDQKLDNELEKLRAELLIMQNQSSQLKDELIALKAPPPKPVVKPVITYTAPATTIPSSATTPSNTRVASIPAAAPSASIVNPVIYPPAVTEKMPDVSFPLSVKDPPVTPNGILPPTAPKGMTATTIPIKTKTSGTIPWRVLIPE